MTSQKFTNLKPHILQTSFTCGYIYVNQVIQLIFISHHKFKLCERFSHETKTLIVKVKK